MQLPNLLGRQEEQGFSDFLHEKFEQVPLQLQQQQDIASLCFLD